VHVDEGYTDPRLARLYDAENPWHLQDDFYLALDLAARSVLDVGCGTGTRLARARETGHTGLLVGVDPAPAMLAVARTKTADVEWVDGAAQSLDLGRCFELLSMTGHAFQLLLDDAAVLAALDRFRAHLTPDGLLAFETRNPGPQPWRAWTRAATAQQVEAPDGEPFELWVEGAHRSGPDHVTFTSVARRLRTGSRRTSRATLRFVDPDRLREHLAATGFAVEGWYGDWDRSPVTDDSPEIVVLARPVP